MKFFIETLGCKVNQYESQLILETLEGNGFVPIKDVEDADLFIINSCTVTAVSDQKMRKIINKVRRLNPNIIILLTGCMPQAFPDESLNIENVDIILGNANRKDLVQSIIDFKENHKEIIKITSHTSSEPFEPMQQVSKFDDRTRAFIKIEDGCNRFCSYCIIPYARGQVRSKSLDQLKNELLKLSENNYKEIVLTGINLCAYGSDIGTNLCEAVETACSIPGIKRVRLGSLEPYYLTEDIIQRFAEFSKFCPQFHISLQSGCNDTLRRMNRHYTSEEYMRIVEQIRKYFENPAITTDVMVGFSGETDAEFNQSLKFVESVGFAKIHVFPYSRRPKTKAYNFDNQIIKKVKLDRAKQMGALADKLRNEFLKSQFGREEEVLFEKKNSKGLFQGYTKNYTPVKLSSDEDLSGKIKKVILDKSNVETDVTV